MTTTPQTADKAIVAAGFALRYVEYCEDTRTPGILGTIRGVTDRARREVKVSTKANPTVAMLAETLEHELHHVLDPEWDCGNRDVFGR